MAKNGSNWVLCALILSSGAVLYVLNTIAVNSDFIPLNKSKKNENNAGLEQKDYEEEETYAWVFKGFLNLLGYSTILIPGYLVYKYVRHTHYLDNKSGSNANLITTLVKKCFEDGETLPQSNQSEKSSDKAPQQRTALQSALLLLFYFTGLQVSFLTWGLLQEKIMTQNYDDKAENSSGKFKDSQFLVFVNRILAFIMSGLVLTCFRRKKNAHPPCPLYKYVFCSISNVLSSWCQYEALKYVSFPHQVLAKASKTIPVMIMGKIVSRNTKYEYYEYVTAFILSIGMLFFMLDTGGKGSNTVTTFSGVILLILYIIFDSFTSNWQGALFKQFQMSPVQMMCGVNLFSCLFTAVSLLQQGGFIHSLNFMMAHPRFIIDCLLLSLCSAAGQLFIFNTIAAFGPLVFAIISTIRQGFAVFLSCLVFNHEINAFGVFGVLLVFFSIFLRIYCSYRMKAMRKKTVHKPTRL